MKLRIGVLDSFRGLAAVSVVYYHYTHWFRKIHGHEFSPDFDFDYGSHSVNFFFIISGFVIFMTVGKCKSPFEFAYKRFIRLYPTYWVCLIFSAVILYFWGIAEMRPTASQFLANLTMVQRLLRSDDVDPSYWSLLPELAFYFLIFFIFAINILHRIYLWGAVWVFASLVNGLLDLHFMEMFFQYSGLFFSGVIFYKMFHGDKRVINHLALLICYVTVVFNIMDGSAKSNLAYIPLGIIYALFYLFLYNKLNFLDNKPLRFLGYISYPLYLIHQGVGFTIILKLKSYGYADYWIIFVPFTLTIIIAYIISRFIEKPIIVFAKDNIEKRLFLKKQDVF